ncbi:MAG TPA: hypothetical protein VLT32_01770, partial [Candidatus Sulfomarinibacteraceae bacterium]|nr:hypothetical protein [Candidatus Sulfomarinibacteraceae bacterium]
LLGPVAVAVGPFDSDLCGLGPQPCVPQPGTAQTLDPRREVLSSLELAVFDDHASLVGSFTVDASGGDRAGVRWFELRSAGGSWSVHDEGLHAPGGEHRWLSAASVDRQGNLAVVTNVSDATGTAPSVRLAGRRAADPPSALTVGEIELRTGAGPQTVGASPERWGAWSSLVVDPSDGCTFWATAPYTINGAWATVVAKFAFQSCGDGPSGALFADDFESGTTGAWAATSP